MSHTPGPWLAKPKAGEIILNASNCYAVQEVYSPQGGHNPADITLMAAAPELLEALKVALGYAEIEMHHETVAEYCDLISRAEGRSK